MELLYGTAERTFGKRRLGFRRCRDQGAHYDHDQHLDLIDYANLSIIRNRLSRGHDPAEDLYAGGDELWSHNEREGGIDFRA